MAEEDVSTEATETIEDDVVNQEEDVQETTGEEGTENENGESEHTNTFIDKLKGHFQDDDLESEEDVVNAALEKLESAKEFEEKTRKKDEKFVELINSSPEFADLLYLMGQGASYEEAHAFITGESDIDLDQAKEGWKKSLADRRKTESERKKAEEKTKGNFQESFERLDKFSKERKLSADQSSGILNKFDQIMLDLSKGVITDETYEIFYKGMKYDTDVKEEKDKSEVKGRNEAIRDLKTKKQTGKGDGLPHPDSAAPKPEAPQEDSPEARIVRGINTWNRPFG